MTLVGHCSQLWLRHDAALGGLHARGTQLLARLRQAEPPHVDDHPNCGAAPGWVLPGLSWPRLIRDAALGAASEAARSDQG